MGGVDLGDQHRGYYHVRMKCRKFYEYIANFLFDVSITNSFILHNISHGDKNMKSVRFRENLAMELIGSYCSRKRAGRGSHVVKPFPFCTSPFGFQLILDTGEEGVRSVKRRINEQIPSGAAVNVTYGFVIVAWKMIVFYLGTRTKTIHEYC